MGIIADSHAVPASVAGIILQLDLALSWLAEGSLHSTVGIETLDDVAVSDGAGTLLGQSKLSLTRNPLTDQSANFWGTLRTWLDIIENEECDIDHTRFFFISNFSINTGLISLLKKAEGNTDALRAVITELRRVGTLCTGDCKELVASVLHPQRTDESLLVFLQRITIADGYPADPEAQLPLLAAKLHLVDDIAENVIRGLRGWVQEKVQSCLVQGKPAWIERYNFCEELSRLIARHHDRKFYLRAIRDFTITDDERQLESDATFVKQLRLVGIEDDDEEMLDAINDFLMSISERTRLSADSNITQTMFASFEDNLYERWKPIHRKHKRSSDDHVVAGYKALSAVLDHREPLAGQPTEEFYFTRGTYHQLANGSQHKRPKLGWHPKFDKLV